MIGKSEVLVEFAGLLVLLDCVFILILGAKDVAQIEVGQRVTRIKFDRAAIVFLRQGVLLPVVMQRAQVDVGSGVLGVEFENPLVEVEPGELAIEVESGIVDS